MSAQCGDGRDVNCVSVGRGSGRAKGILGLERGEVLIGAVLMILVIKEGTEAGVTFSMIVKAGRRRIVVGSA